MAASMAGIILAGGGKNENVIRYGFPASYVLLHDGYVALESSEARTADDIMEFNKGVDADIRNLLLAIQILLQRIMIRTRANNGF